MFSSKAFVISSTITSLTHLELVCVKCKIRAKVNFLSIWICNWSSATYWKEHHFLCNHTARNLCHKSEDHMYVGLFQGSLFCSIGLLVRFASVSRCLNDQSTPYHINKFKKKNISVCQKGIWQYSAGIFNWKKKKLNRDWRKQEPHKVCLPQTESKHYTKWFPLSWEKQLDARYHH